MAENTEVEDRVDLDDDNYTEEDDEEPMEDEGVGEGGEENEEEPQEDTTSEDAGKGQSPGTDKNDICMGDMKDKDKSASINEDEKEKHAELLDLPPQGSEVFIGGLSRDISEEDLRELCEPLGETFEIRVMKNRDTGESKGFAFVAFRTKDKDNNLVKALYIKNIPENTPTEQLKEIFQEHGEVTKVVMLPAKAVMLPENTPTNLFDCRVFPLEVEPHNRDLLLKGNFYV